MRYLEQDIGLCRFVAADTEWLYSTYVMCADALKTVSKTRYDKAMAYKFEKDRELSALASVLLDRLLSRYGLKERDMEYVEEEEGKPAFAGYPDLYFSLAHSEKMAAAMLGKVPVGVDIEYLPGFPRDIAEPLSWTEKESVGKLIGCGIGCYVDGEDFEIPLGVETSHLLFGDYLLCAAWQNNIENIN